MRLIAGYTISLVFLFGCSKDTSSEDRLAAKPYQLGQALVIGQASGGQLVVVNEGCETDACRAVLERCGADAYADVVVAADGDVLDVLCLRGNASIEAVGTEAVPSASAGNNTVLLLDADADGADVTGNVVLTGNNAAILGQGVDVSQIGGDLVIDKNNALVRSVTISGDVTIDKNNAQLAFTEIFGDVTINGNNTTLAECTVHGALHITGTNTVLVQNRFAGARSLSGKNLACNGNVSFEETAADAGVGDAGAGLEAPVECTRTNGAPGDQP
jgi:hypothetical protein